jgi:hypothetical protein
MTNHRRPTRGRYHITVTELVDGQLTIVMDATGEAFHAIVGTLDPRTARLHGDAGKGGPPHLLEHLADLITDNTIYTR